MIKPQLSVLALLLALSAPLTVAAQTTTEAPATGEAPAAGEAPADGVDVKITDGAAPADGLTIGTEVGAEPKVGDTYVKEKFGDDGGWEQRCVKTEKGIDPCQLYHLMKDADGNNVAEFTVFTLPEGTEGPAVAGATFIAPLETLLSTGMTLQVDENKTRAYPFTFCTQIGCIARIGFTAEEVAMFKKGATATMTIVPFVAPDKKVQVSVSLKGFTAGLEAVDTANKAADAEAKAAKKSE